MTELERARLLRKARKHFADKGHPRAEARKLARILVTNFERDQKAGRL